jgi:hypothetical protein
MTENHCPRDFADKLVSQDAVVTGFDFEESNMNLKRSLESLQRRAKFVHRASLIASAVAVACWVAILPMEAFRLLARFEWMGAAWGICSGAALVVAGVLLVLYRDKYSPALERAKTDLQISMIADLQRQIAALSQRLDDRANK